MASGVQYQTESCPSHHGPSVSTPVRSALRLQTGHSCCRTLTPSWTSLQSTRAHRAQATTPQLPQVCPQGPLTLATGHRPVHSSHARGAGPVHGPSHVALEGLGSTPGQSAVQSQQHLPTCGPGASMGPGFGDSGRSNTAQPSSYAWSR